MDILKDLYYTNRSVSKKALNSLIKNWFIIFTGLFYSTATVLLLVSLSSFSKFKFILDIRGVSLGYSY